MIVLSGVRQRLCAGQPVGRASLCHQRPEKQVPVCGRGCSTLKAGGILLQVGESARTSFFVGLLCHAKPKGSICLLHK